MLHYASSLLIKCASCLENKINSKIASFYTARTNYFPIIAQKRITTLAIYIRKYQNVTHVDEFLKYYKYMLLLKGIVVIFLKKS